LQKGKYFERNKEAYELIERLDTIVRKFVIPLFLLVAFTAIHWKIPYPILPIGIVVAFYIISIALGNFIIKNGFLPFEKAYFSVLFLNCIFIAFETYFTGGIESFIPIFYIIIGVLAGLTLPLWGIVSITLTAGICYISELLLEIYNIVPHISLFKEFMPQASYKSSIYMRITPVAYYIITITIISLAFHVSNNLRKRQEYLSNFNKDLDKSSKLLVRRDLEINSLNQELDNKIHELEALKTGLEERVKDRTKELETAKNKLEEKVSELEEFHDLTVDRELKMIALEKELEKLKEKKLNLL